MKAKIKMVLTRNTEDVEEEGSVIMADTDITVDTMARRGIITMVDKKVSFDLFTVLLLKQKRALSSHARLGL